MFGTERKLRAQIAAYEDALTRIAGKPQELTALGPARGSAQTAASAYEACAKIATMALWDWHPEMQAEAEREGRERTERAIAAQAELKR